MKNLMTRECLKSLDAIFLARIGTMTGGARVFSISDHSASNRFQGSRRLLPRRFMERDDGWQWLKALAKFSALVCVIIVPFSGCGTTETALFEEELTPYGSAKLTEGNTLAITFPGSPNLNTTQQIRHDGKIDLQLVGEITAAGRTPAELEKEIIKLYEPQIALRQVTVAVQSSSYPVFVTGSVMHPGKVMVDRPISALEAIMEAGGFDDAKANLRKVRVLRHEGGKLKPYTLNLKRVLEGSSKQLFYLRPSDIVYVPEKNF